MRSELYDLRDHVRIQEESAHRLTFLPWSGFRCKSKSTPRSGERRKNSTKLLGWRWRAVSSSNSSAGTITTASFPPRVTYCGPSLRARRKTSLNCALAVWICQRGGDFAPDFV